MAKVYYKAIDSYSKTGDISRGSRELLEKVTREESIALEKSIPLKVHFGEKGNKTYIGPENFEGVIDFLEERGICSCFIETNVLYVSARTTRKGHAALAEEHGFTALPIVIADGEKGEDYSEVEIDKNHFRKCRIGRLMAESRQMIVLSHFKGHILAGFGGAIKQLGMGCASRAGKLDQHANSLPAYDPSECNNCMACVSSCPMKAIEVAPILKVDKKRCIGCAACIASCPQEAFSVDWTATAPKAFREKLAEYAYAAHAGKKNIYINYCIKHHRGLRLRKQADEDRSKGHRHIRIHRPCRCGRRMLRDAE